MVRPALSAVRHMPGADTTAPWTAARSLAKVPDASIRGRSSAQAGPRGSNWIVKGAAPLVPMGTLEPAGASAAQDHGGRSHMPGYFRFMPGPRAAHATLCARDGFVGVGFGIESDMAGLGQSRADFDPAFDALYRDCHPGASKVGLGLARTATWLIVQGLAEGDIVLSPDGPGSSTYLIGHVTAPYQYASGQFLPHRRPVSWSPQRIDKQQLSDELRTALKFGGPVLDLNAYSAELVSLPPVRSEYEPEGEALHVIERHLEDFLVTNWASTPFGATHKLMEVDGAVVGQQFRTSTGPIDILAVSHDGAELLVVELKRGRASDRVIGQVLRYMGCVTKDLAEENQRVRGAIIALEDDPRIRMALAMVPDVDFYRYSIHFSMTKA